MTLCKHCGEEIAQCSIPTCLCGTWTHLGSGLVICRAPSCAEPQIVSEEAEPNYVSEDLDTTVPPMTKGVRE